MNQDITDTKYSRRDCFVNTVRQRSVILDRQFQATGPESEPGNTRVHAYAETRLSALLLTVLGGPDSRRYRCKLSVLPV